ncbi:MAG: glycosyltransferase family 2 protein [Clostridia bacterium]|nr:glycosyltransferase family 2 protein [Clostridia bacterium]
MEMISIIVPCFNEQENINIFYEYLIKIFKNMDCDFEIIFVDDGSQDKTLDEIKKLSNYNNKIKYISFSRNFGKESAIFAGFEKYKGDYVTIMDADLQDPPELLIDMYHTIRNELYDCVAARRITRTNESKLRSFLSKKFYSIINKISEVEIADGARDYRLMTRKMVNAILSMKECTRFSKGIFSWVGFHTKWLSYKNITRTNGKTSWSLIKLFSYAINGITSFSDLPLSISSLLGILMCLISFIMICIIIFKTLIFGDPTSGYPSLICTIVFIGGIQLFCIGILGQYLSKVYIEVKKRPMYIIKEEKI